jgi:hypothetical protein
VSRELWVVEYRTTKGDWIAGGIVGAEEYVRFVSRKFPDRRAVRYVPAPDADRKALVEACCKVVEKCAAPTWW